MHQPVWQTGFLLYKYRCIFVRLSNTSAQTGRDIGNGMRRMESSNHSIIGLSCRDRWSYIFHLSLFCFAEGQRAIWCQIFARIFHPIILYVHDVAVILDRKHNRDNEHTIEMYRLCNFPHIRFCWNFAGLLVRLMCI